MAPDNVTGRAGRRLRAFRGEAGAALAGAEAMLDGVAASGVPAARWCTTVPPALLLGASQDPSVVNAEACREAGVAVYKRAAGGAVVLAGEGLLGFDIALPIDHPLVLSDLTQSYRWIGNAWAEALESLCLPARLVGVDEARAGARATDDASRLARLACFGALSPYEVTLGGRKVVGLAQVRRRHGALFQCAVLLSWSPAQLAALLAVRPGARERLVAALAERAIGLNDGAAQSVTCAEIVAAVDAALDARGLSLADASWTPAELDATSQLCSQRYGVLEPREL